MDFTTLKTNLEKMGYLVTCFDTAVQASEYLEQSITDKTVGIGGSVTIQQMNLYKNFLFKIKYIGIGNWKTVCLQTKPAHLPVMRTSIYLL